MVFSIVKHTGNIFFIDLLQDCDFMKSSLCHSRSWYLHTAMAAYFAGEVEQWYCHYMRLSLWYLNCWYLHTNMAAYFKRWILCTQHRMFVGIHRGMIYIHRYDFKRGSQEDYHCLPLSDVIFMSHTCYPVWGVGVHGVHCAWCVGMVGW